MGAAGAPWVKGLDEVRTYRADELVTLNPYTGVEGPQIVAGAATADSTRALAVERARAAGPS